MTQDITTTGPSRRSIAKGAAWAVPAVTVAAAAPSLAASTEECAPETCATPVLSAVQLIATRSARNTSTLTFAGAITAAIGGCTGTFSLGVATLTEVAVTWTSRSAVGSSIPATTTTTTIYPNLTLGVNALGALIVPTVGLAIPGVSNVQNGLYTGIANAGLLPSRPTQLCFKINYTRILGGGLPDQQCQAQVCIDTAVVLAVGVVTSNGGAVTFTLADVGGA
ncbi:hypothetical protein [Janibacter hoylei]|uniref:hypothetical protein n=1 Tax=Janibacter hoylei TaxID=364298 RepID=UPI00248F808A|nr:hypothetical protein [Janibacter hoylei]